MRLGSFCLEWSSSGTESAARFLLIKLQADFELLDGFVRRAEGFNAMATEVMSGVFHVLFGAAKGGQRFVDFRMRLGCCRGGGGR